MSKVTNEEVYKIIQSQDEISKINIESIVKEALLSLPTKIEEEEELERRKILEYLDNIKQSSLKEFLNSIRNKKIQLIRGELEKQIDKHNNNLFNLVMKTSLELKEEKKMNDIMKKEITNLNDKIIKLHNYNKVLLSQVKEYQNNLLSLQKKYSDLSSQKNLFEEIMEGFPGKTPKEIVSELKIAKQGSTIMLESYTNINQELTEMKKYQKDLDKKYNKKINYLTNENDQLLSERKEDKEKYIKIINELKNRMELNENKIKESDYLRNTLYHIYNILYDKLNLVKDIAINEKYIGLTEKDFKPDVLYDPELVNYIELMVKRMKSDSYDKLFRECIGYLNMIIRNYLPDKKKLRFKPDKIFREITNFIDLKMKAIEEYQNVIKHNKKEMNNMQLNINKLTEKYQNLSKEYESYKILVEKNMEKNNKTHFKYKDDKNKYILKNENEKFNQNNGFQPQNMHKRKGYILNENNLNFNSENEENSKNSNKKKLEKKYSVDKKRILSAYKGNSIYNRYYYNIKNQSEKNLRNKNTFYSFDKKSLSLNKRKKINKIRESLSKNKLIKENGNQQNINNLNKINNIIDETNRLFLYQSRMGSFQKKFQTIDNDEKITIENPDINTNIRNELFEKNLVKTFEGKIIQKLNKLINSSKMK